MQPMVTTCFALLAALFPWLAAAQVAREANISLD
jgi:hypothetical protein